jgi:signal transduction histidine kinase/integral membrane sensor domain MASE1
MLRDAAPAAILLFVAYLLSAELSNLVGTFSNRIFAPLWLTNVVLFAALMSAFRDRILLCVAMALPAHVIAGIETGLPLAQILAAFVAGVAIAVVSSQLALRMLGETPWLGTTSKAARYIVLIGFACPAIFAFVGGAAPILGGRGHGQYLTYWTQWFLANAVGALTLGTAAILVVEGNLTRLWQSGHARQIEAIGLLFAVFITTHAALQTGKPDPADLLRLPLIYAPVAWLAIRFGVAGAGVSVVVVTMVATWHAMNGTGPFIHGDASSNTIALQTFLIALAVPMLLLGAASDQAQAAEDRLDEEKERISLAASVTNAGFYRHEFSSGTTWVSDSGRGLLGLPAAGDLTRERMLAGIHPDDCQIAASVMFADRRRAGESSAEFRVLSSDGSLRWVMARSRTKASKHRNAYDTGGIVLDVTARKSAEAEAEQRRRELTHLMRVSQMGQLSGSLAHELSQPLTAILAKAEVARVLLRETPCDSKAVTAAVDTIIREDQRAGEIIKRMRSLLKNKELTVEPIDINDLCQGVRMLLHVELINKGATLDIVPAPDLPIIFGDSVQLQQVLINLVMNAIEAAHRVDALRRTVVITIRRLGADKVEIAVRDNGPGIGADEQAHLFEPFFTTKERGLGLGLPICSTILRRHGGTLSLENNDGHGVTAFLRLPIRPNGVPVS